MYAGGNRRHPRRFRARAANHRHQRLPVCIWPCFHNQHRGRQGRLRYRARLAISHATTARQAETEPASRFHRERRSDRFAGRAFHLSQSRRKRAGRGRWRCDGSRDRDMGWGRSRGADRFKHAHRRRDTQGAPDRDDGGREWDHRGRDTPCGCNRPPTPANYDSGAECTLAS